MNESTKAVKTFLDNRLFAFYEPTLEAFKTALSGLLVEGIDEARSKLIKLTLQDADWEYLHNCQAKRFKEEKSAGDYAIPF